MPFDVDKLEALGFFRHVPPAKLGEARDVMRASGCLLNVVDPDEHGGGILRRMYFQDPESLAEGAREILFEAGWGETLQATISLLNELLLAHRSPERAHAIFYGSNDGGILFATEEMARILNAGTDEPHQLLHDGGGAPTDGSGPAGSAHQALRTSARS